MPDPFRKVRSGEPVRFSATAWNRFIDAAKAEQMRRFNQGTGALSTYHDAEIIRIKNESGLDLLRGSVLGLDAPIFLPSQSIDAFLREVAFRCVVPTADHAGRFVVLLEPARAGMIAKAYAAGAAQVRVNVVDEAHQCADVADGETGALVSSATGSAGILWREGGTGEQWATIRFDITCKGCEPYCLTVTVLDTNDDPVEGALVELVTVPLIGDETIHASGETDENGQVQLCDLTEVGLRTLRASKAGYGDAVTIVDLACEEGQEQTLVLGIEIACPECTSAPATITLHRPSDSTVTLTYEPSLSSPPNTVVWRGTETRNGQQRHSSSCALIAASDWTIFWEAVFSENSGNPQFVITGHKIHRTCFFETWPVGNLTSTWGSGGLFGGSQSCANLTCDPFSFTVFLSTPGGIAAAANAGPGGTHTITG